MKTKVRIFKLRSGEDVVATVGGKSGDKYTLQRPMSMKFTTIHGALGMVEERVFMRNWLSATVSNDIKIPDDWIVAISTPTPEIINQYEQMLEAEDIPPVDSKKESFDIPESFSKMIDEMKKEEEMMKNSTSAIPTPPKGFVSMNLVIPPELFMDMIKGGLLGGIEEFDDEGDDWFFDSDRFKDDDWDGGI